MSKKINYLLQSFVFKQPLYRVSLYLPIIELILLT